MTKTIVGIDTITGEEVMFYIVNRFKAQAIVNGLNNTNPLIRWEVR